MTYDPEQDHVHGSGWNSATRRGGWSWRKPRYGEFFRTCDFCGSIHPEDLVAEQAGLGVCATCGRAGWEEHFRALKPAWYVHASEAERELLTPEELERAIQGYDDHSYDPQGWYASWADQKYGWPHKFYVEGLRSRDPSLLHCISSIGNAKEPPAEGYMNLQWYQVKSCPRKLLKAAKADGMVYSAEIPENWLGFGTKTTLHAKFYTKHLADPNVSEEVKDQVCAVSGLYFKFDPDGHVYWAKTKEALQKD